MDAPKNCRECRHKDNCKSYYGGSMCKHMEAINSEAARKAGIK